MDTFDELKETWLSSDMSDLPNYAIILKSAKKYQKLQVAKSVIGFLLAIALLFMLTYVFISYNSKFLSTLLGELCMFSALLILLYLRFQDVSRIALFRFSNDRFLKMLKLELTKSLEYQKRTQAVGFALASFGLLLYIYELIYQNYTMLIVGYCLLVVWLSIMWFIVKPYMMKRKINELQRKIKTFERISFQLSEAKSDE